MTDYDELARLAREATPGPWEALGSRLKVARGIEGLGRMESDGTDYSTGETLTWDQMEHDTTSNAAYIAAASPDVILALLEERRVLREAILRGGLRLPGFDHWRERASSKPSDPDDVRWDCSCGYSGSPEKVERHWSALQERTEETR